MRNFWDTFETQKRSFIRAFSICLTVPLMVVLEIVQLTWHFYYVVNNCVIMVNNVNIFTIYEIRRGKLY